MASHYISDERLNISRGHVKGTSLVHVIGYNSDVDTSSDPETVWSHGGLYPWSAFNANGSILTLNSSSASDTMVVTVAGLDANLTVISENVTLNGTANVATTKAFKRISSMTSSNTNVGDIHANINSTCVAHISAGDAQTLQAVYTVPSNKTGYLYCGDTTISSYTKDAVIRFYVRYPGASFRVAHVVCLAGNNYRYDFPFPLPLPAGTDLEVQVDEVTDSNCKITANFDILLIDTPV